ncbi:MAG TPA: hypothetical protein VGJ13_05375 [Pseudonocardiaceae bacterium]
MTEELITAAAAAAERGISESRMRDLISAAAIAAVARQPGRAGRNLYPAEELRAIPGPAQGQRNDLTAQRIGEMVAAARVIAEGADRYDEWSKLDARIIDGNPGAVRALVPATRRWARRNRAQAAALARFEMLNSQIGDLGAAILPMRMREQIIIAEAKSTQASTAKTGTETEGDQA